MFSIVSLHNSRYRIERAPQDWKDAISHSVRIEAVDLPTTRESSPHFDDSVKVKVYCGALNYFDLNRVYAGLTASEGNRYECFGSEIAGCVLGIGRNVTDFKEGDLVVTRIAGPCGECAICRQGRPGCAVLARKTRCAFQQETWIHHQSLKKIEGGVTPMEAVAVQFSGGIAADLVERYLPGHEGEALLVTGANCAIGAYVTQLAAQRGIAILALTRSERTLKQCKASGASAALAVVPDGPLSALEERIKASGIAARFDTIIDFAVDFYSRYCLDLTRPGGKYILAGKSGSASARIPSRDIMGLRIKVEPYVYREEPPSAKPEKSPGLSRVRPMIDSIFSFEQAEAACRRAWWSAGKYGKVLITFVDAGSCEVPVQ